MDILDWAAKYAGVLQLALASAFGVALLWLRASFVPRSEFRAVVDEIEKQMAAQDVRIGKQMAMQDVRIGESEKGFAKIMGALEAMPKQADFLAISVSMVKLEGKLGQLGEGVNGVKEIVNRVEAQVSRHESIFSDAARARP